MMPTVQMPIVYVDMDDVLCDFTGAHQLCKTNQPDLEYPQSLEGFFLGLKPIDGALEAVNQLRECFDVYVLTAPSTRNPHCYSEKRIWIEQHFDYSFTKKLILSPNKSLLIGEYLVDDHESGKGQEGFRGELLRFGSTRFPSWPSVVSYLLSSDARRKGTGV